MFCFFMAPRLYLLGPFVGYQLCLDLALIFPGWFNCQEVCEVGPGAVEMLAKCCDALPDTMGMVDASDGRVYQMACTPIAMFLQKMGHIHPAAARLRVICKKVGLAYPTANDWQYHSCEVRQVRDRLRSPNSDLRYEPIADNDTWYCDCLECPPLRALFMGQDVD